MRRPRILVTLDTGEELRKGVPFPSVHMKTAYVRAVENGGGTPILAAPTDNREVIASFAEMFDGLVITGGAFDIAPEAYGRTQTGRLDAPKPVRTAFEWALLDAALERGRPVLGICGGMQLLNVVLGGTLIQDIASEVPGARDHEQSTSPATADHEVVLVDSALTRALGRKSIQVNTTHHQAVAVIGRGLSVLGSSPDGVVEAIGHLGDFRVMGVQWHPELLDDDVSRLLYAGLVNAALQTK